MRCSGRRGFNPAIGFGSRVLRASKRSGGWYGGTSGTPTGSRPTCSRLAMGMMRIRGLLSILTWSRWRMARILIACEFSGIVRDAFRARGHEAWSCDLLPSERPGPHIQGNVLDVLGNGWALAICHPPCTALTRAGDRWYTHSPDRLKAALFVSLLAG